MSYAKLICKKETQAYFNSPAAYIFLIVFLLLSGWFFANPLFISKTANLSMLFNMVPLFFLFLIPVITMGTLAKEKDSGTFELLATFPLTESNIVLGKFWAAMKLIVIGLAFTLIHLITIMILGEGLDYGAIFCGYLGLIFVGGVYAAIGIFASSITGNQIVSFIISFIIILFLYMIQYFLFFLPSGIASLFQYISVTYHYSSMSRGVIDTRNILYFLGVTFVFLQLSVNVMQARKWK